MTHAMLAKKLPNASADKWIGTRPDYNFFNSTLY